jgi:photosystem II stability/assembly factor-like uncharacterized protein
MRKIVLALAVAALTLAAVPASQAAPIAPLGSVVATDHSSTVTKVWWHHHRHCWRGRYGRLHCSW